nr:MAG TPA: hypothetical protein [Caudoviricetes sp.]
MRIFRNKQNKEKIVEAAIPEVKPLETPVVTKEEPKEEKEPKTTTSKKKTKVVCKVLLATPSYFVINKNGEKITIKKKNNYHRNEEILY